MNCPSCNEENKEGAKFCGNCGAKLPLAPVQQPEAIPQPDISGYSASIGDKNVISGNIIGKNEEFKIAGNATINKIEDDTKRIINCAISGKRILFSESIQCPVCQKDVSKEYFNFVARRCTNCDSRAQEEYRQNVSKILSRGVIGLEDRSNLDAIASRLQIGEEKRYEIEVASRAKRAETSSALGGFHKIEFEKAKKAVFDDINASDALKQLQLLFNKNPANDELANWYYLVSALVAPKEYLKDFVQRNFDLFWQHYWAFLAYLKTKQVDKAFDEIESNKSAFSDRLMELLISEAAFYVYCFLTHKEKSYWDAAHSSLGKVHNVPTILGPFFAAIQNILSVANPNPETLAKGLRNDDAAVDFFLRNIFVHKPETEVFCDHGWEFYHTKSYAQAISEFNNAIAADDANAGAYWGRGLALHDSGDYKNALPDFDKAIQIDPGKSTYYLSRALAHVKMAHYQQAMEDINKVIELEPNSERAYTVQGEIYTKAGDQQRAIASYDKALILNPRDSDAYASRGALRNEMKDYRASITDNTTALEINPGNENAWYGRGVAKVNCKDYQGAILDFTKAIDINPETNATLYYGRGVTWMLTHEYYKAIADMTRSIQINPAYAFSYKYRGDMYMAVKEYQKAAADYKKALEVNPGLADAQTGLRLATSKMGVIGRIQQNTNELAAKGSDLIHNIVEDKDGLKNLGHSLLSNLIGKNKSK
jgi:tetratricopeptide (TPR) repeat protein